MDPKAETPPRKRISRRASIIGSVIALVALAGIGWLAWHLTHPSTDAAAGPGGFGAGRRGPPSTTVGVATGAACVVVGEAGLVGAAGGVTSGKGFGLSQAESSSKEPVSATKAPPPFREEVSLGKRSSQQDTRYITILGS